MYKDWMKKVKIYFIYLPNSHKKLIKILDKKLLMNLNLNK